MKKFFKRFIKCVCWSVCIAALMWLLVSWIDVLLHNDPVTGDKSYWKGNAFVLMIGGSDDI